jgi:hypothetical protein
MLETAARFHAYSMNNRPKRSSTSSPHGPGWTPLATQMGVAKTVISRLERPAGHAAIDADLVDAQLGVLQDLPAAPATERGC